MGRGGVSIERFGLTDPRIREFAYLPWRLYRGDPCWTPTLMMDLLGNRLLGVKGLLTPAHPYHRISDVTHFIARRDGRAVGRVSASVNRRFNEYHGSRLGFFGHFEAEEDPEVAGALLDAAREWVAAQGMETIRGPGEYSTATHERQGVLIEGFEHCPTVDLTHNPPYYRELIEGYGFVKAMDWVAHRVMADEIPHERIRRLCSLVREREGDRLTTRPAELSRFREEVRLIAEIYNEAWADNWGHLPLTLDDADAVAEALRPIVDPGLVRFAYVDGKPIAVFGGIPDPNWALRPRWKWYGDSDAVRLARVLAMRGRIPRVRLMFFGIHPDFRRAGVDAVLFEEVFAYGVEHGYVEAEASLMLETNVMIIRPVEAMGGREYKRWRVYEMPVA